VIDWAVDGSECPITRASGAICGNPIAFAGRRNARSLLAIGPRVVVLLPPHTREVAGSSPAAPIRTLSVIPQRLCWRDERVGSDSNGVTLRQRQPAPSSCTETSSLRVAPALSRTQEPRRGARRRTVVERALCFPARRPVYMQSTRRVTITVCSCLTLEPIFARDERQIPVERARGKRDGALRDPPENRPLTGKSPAFRGVVGAGSVGATPSHRSEEQP
jgi:hypothetical protein